MLATLMVSSTMMAGNVKKSTTLPIEGEIVKASHPMIQYVGRVSFAKNPDVASFNYPGTTIEASFQGSSLKCCVARRLDISWRRLMVANLSKWALMPNAIRLLPWLQLCQRGASC